MIIQNFGDESHENKFYPLLLQACVASTLVSGLLRPNTQPDPGQSHPQKNYLWLHLSPSLIMDPSQPGLNAARLFWSQNLDKAGGGVTLNLYPVLLIGSIVSFFFVGTFLNVPVFNISADIVSKIFWGHGFGARTQDFIDSYARRADTKPYQVNNAKPPEWGRLRQYPRHMGGHWKSGGVAVVGY